MASRAKLYALKSALDVNESIKYLEELADCELGPGELASLAITEGKGLWVNPAGLRSEGQELEPEGLHEVIEGAEQGLVYGYESFDVEDVTGYPYLHLDLDTHGGKTAILQGSTGAGGITQWKATGGKSKVFFKPADIQALADKLNGKTPAEIQPEELSVLRKQIEALEAENKALKAHGAVADGLNFPYCTPELDAMRKAVANFWEPYTEDKRKPIQKQIAPYIAEVLGNNNIRKAEEYARAIVPLQHRKPD